MYMKVQTYPVFYLKYKYCIATNYTPTLQLTYDYVDVAAAGRRKNPSLRPQAQPGSVAPVEYASVDYAM